MGGEEGGFFGGVGDKEDGFEGGGVCGGGLEGGLGVVYDLEAGLGVQAFEGFVQKEEVVGG